jgi:hypothetical protein
LQVIELQGFFILLSVFLGYYTILPFQQFIFSKTPPIAGVFLFPAMIWFDNLPGV